MGPGLRRLAMLMLATVIATFALFAAAPPAGAEVSGGCDAFLLLPNGQRVSVRDLASDDPGKAIHVSKDDSVKVTLVSSGADHQQVHLEFAGQQIPIIDARQTVGADGQWSGTLRPDHYAPWGVGLYKIVWDETGASGKCQATALIRISGFPLFTVAGSVSTTLGTAAAIATLVLIFHAGQPWSIELVGDGSVVRKRRWAIVVTSIGASVAFSFVSALSAFVMLQETALAAPTVRVLLQLTLPFTLFGFLGSSVASLVGHLRGRSLA